MPRQRRLVPIIGAVVIISLVVVALLLRTRLASQADTALTSGSGTIEATEIEVGAKVAGRIAKMHVDEGDRVAEGDLIAELDHAELDADVTRAEGALQSAQAFLRELQRGSRDEQIAAARARLAQAAAAAVGAQQQVGLAQENVAKGTELKQKVDDAAAQVRAAEAALAGAQAQRDEAVAGLRPQEVRQIEAQLAQAEAALQGATVGRAAAEEQQQLQQQYSGPAVEAGTARATADLAHRLAQERESLVREGPTAEQVTQARESLAASEATLVQTRTRYERIETMLREEAATQQELDDAQAAFATAQARRTAAAAALTDLERGARAQELRAAELTSAQAAAALDGAERAVPNAGIAQQQALVASRQRAEVAATDVARSAAARDGAEAALALAREGTRGERIAQARAGVAQAEANRVGARAAWENAQEAYADRISARQQLETAQTQLEVARAQRNAAAADLQLLLAGNTQEAMDNAHGQVQQAAAALQRTVVVRQDAEIRAPAGGTITERVAEPGEVLTPGATVVTMVDLQHMWLKVYLPVKLLARVRAHQPVQVHIDAQPGRDFPGRVTTISQEAEFTPKNVQTVEQRVQQVFWVKVDVGDGQGVLKPGLPADAVFE